MRITRLLARPVLSPSPCSSVLHMDVHRAADMDDFFAPRMWGEVPEGPMEGDGADTTE